MWLNCASLHKNFTNTLLWWSGLYKKIPNFSIMLSTFSKHWPTLRMCESSLCRISLCAFTCARKTFSSRTSYKKEILFLNAKKCITSMYGGRLQRILGRRVKISWEKFQQSLMLHRGDRENCCMNFSWRWWFFKDWWFHKFNWSLFHHCYAVSFKF